VIRQERELAAAEAIMQAMAKVYALVIAIGALVFRVVLVYEEEKRLSSGLLLIAVQNLSPT
jgi:hypothetical protein